MKRPEHNGVTGRLVRGLAWTFVWLTRIVVWTLATGYVLLVLFAAIRGWPTPLYAIGSLVVVGALLAGVAQLYYWCKNKLDP